MKVYVDSERCQGHTLCAMIAPDSFELNDIDGTSSPVNEVVRARSGRRGARSRAVVPRTGHLDRGMRKTVERRRHQAPPTAPARRIGTTSTGTPRSTGCSSRRSPRRCRPSARWRGRRSTTGTGWLPTARKSSSWPAARWCPTITTSTVSARATRASRSRRRNGPRSCAAASWRWTSPSTASTAAR